MSKDTQTSPEEHHAGDAVESPDNTHAAEQSMPGEVNLMAELEKALAEAQTSQEKAKAAEEKHLRTLADMENLRRRFAREKEDIRRLAAAALIEDLLPALDNLDIGLSSAARHPEASEVAKGFEFVAAQFIQILNDHGLERLAPAPGDAFDHNIHEAVAQEASASIPDHHVVKAMRTGYRLNERLLRPASVVVSSGSAKDDA